MLAKRKGLQVKLELIGERGNNEKSVPGAWIQHWKYKLPHHSHYHRGYGENDAFLESPLRSRSIRESNRSSSRSPRPIPPPDQLYGKPYRIEKRELS